MVSIPCKAANSCIYSKICRLLVFLSASGRMYYLCKKILILLGSPGKKEELLAGITLY